MGIPTFRFMHIHVVLVVVVAGESKTLQRHGKLWERKSTRDAQWPILFFNCLKNNKTPIVVTEIENLFSFKFN